MVSNLQAAKYYFEELFHDKWTSTAIQYAGQEFNAGDITEWVNVVYKPSSITSNGLSRATSNNYGKLIVTCWSDTDVGAMKMSDDVISFIGLNQSSSYRLKNYDINDHGWYSDNSVFIEVSFNIESTAGECITYTLL